MSLSSEDLRRRVIEELRDEDNARVVLQSMVKQLEAALDLGRLLLGDEGDGDADLEPRTVSVGTLGGERFEVEVPPERFPDVDEPTGL